MRCVDYAGLSCDEMNSNSKKMTEKNGINPLEIPVVQEQQQQ